MTFVQILDAAALAVLAAQSGWIVMLYRRMGRLRVALDSAGDVIGQLDAASKRLDASAGGIAQKVKDGLGEVDGKITACRRVAQELTAASRQAEEVAARLDQALRQNRKLQHARAAAPPRELAEPLGLAARLAGRPAPQVLEMVPAALPMPMPALDTERLAEVAVEQLLAHELLPAEMLLAAAPAMAPPVPERRVFRLTLD
jgi:ABC-type transporter Mla subunit MlaD